MFPCMVYSRVSCIHAACIYVFMHGFSNQQNRTNVAHGRVDCHNGRVGGGGGGGAGHPVYDRVVGNV